VPQATLFALCPADELAPGKMRRFEIPGGDAVLLCNFNGVFHAIEDDCTHAIASLANGRLEGSTVFCPMHGGSFNVVTGKALSLPCKQALRSFPVEVRDGTVFVGAGR